MTAFDWTRKLARGATRPVASRDVVVRNDEPLEQRALKLMRHDCSKVDIDHARELFALLAMSPSGRDDLAIFVDHGITLAFDTRKGGAGYVRDAKLILLTRTQVAARTALDFVHEVTHARLHMTRTGSDIDAQSQEHYIRAILFEESQTYFREALVGRELIHLVRDAAVKKSLFTVHTLQMWFQLVHGVAYHRAPSAEALAADLALDSRALGELVRDLHPYFQRYVEFYRNVESAKWEIRRGLRRPEKQEVVSGVLSMCASEQDHDWTYPRRRAR